MRIRIHTALKTAENPGYYAKEIFVVATLTAPIFFDILNTNKALRQRR